MKILYVSFYFPPFNTMGGIRAAGQVKELENAGHDVKVISANYQGNFGSLNLGPYDVKLYEVSKKSNIDIEINSKNKTFLTSLKQIVLNNKNIPFRDIIFYLHDIITLNSGIQKLWQKMVINDVKTYKDWQPDVIFASHSPLSSILIGKHLSKMLEIPFFVEIRDSWSFNPIISFKKEENIFSKLLRKYEMKILEGCSGIISVTSFIERYYSRHFPHIPNEKIYGGYDKHDLSLGNAKINKLGKPFTITHAGSLLKGRKSPEILFQAISSNKLLKDNFSINFFGNDQSEIANLAKLYSLEDNVSCCGTIDYLDCKKTEACSDILLILMQNLKNEKYAVTGKIFDLIKLKKPIMMIYGEDSEAENILQKSGLGKSFTSKEGIVEYLLRFIKNQDMVINANDTFIKELSRESQIKSMIKFITPSTLN